MYHHGLPRPLSYFGSKANAQPANLGSVGIDLLPKLVAPEGDFHPLGYHPLIRTQLYPLLCPDLSKERSLTKTLL